MVLLMSLTACGSRPYGILQKDSSLAENEDVNIHKLSDTTMDFLNNKNEMPKNEDITKRKENDTAVQFYSVLGGINNREAEQQKISKSNLNPSPFSAINNDFSTNRKKLPNIESKRLALVKAVEKIFADEGRKLPVVDHMGIKMIEIVKHMKTCIDEESIGTFDEYEGIVNVNLRIKSDGIVKYAELTDERNIPVYVQSCLLSGIYRVIFPKIMGDGENFTDQSIKMSLKNPVDGQAKKVNIMILSDVTKISTL